MKQESKREQKRNEKLRQENIEKFDEEYKKADVHTAFGGLRFADVFLPKCGQACVRNGRHRRKLLHLRQCLCAAYRRGKWKAVGRGKGYRRLGG